MDVASRAGREDAAVNSIDRTLAIVGDRWSLLVLRGVFRGLHRFSQLEADLGIAKNLLADRLTRLVDNGLLDRVQYQERPVRHEYRLTDKGRDLSPALVALKDWGDRWCVEGEPETVLLHDRCCTPVVVDVRCPSCGTAVSPAHITSSSTPFGTEQE